MSEENQPTKDEAEVASASETADTVQHEPAPQELTPAELAESRLYGKKSLVCDLIDMAVNVAFLLVAALMLAQPLDAWLQQHGWRTLWTRLLGFYIAITALHYAISFPLSFYSGYVLEHRFGLSKQRLGRWLKRYMLRIVLVTLFSAALIQGLFWTIWLCGWWWWMVATAATFFISVLLGKLVPVLILPLFYKIDRLEDEEILARLEALSADTTLTIEGVYRMTLSNDTVKANAMLAGLGRTRRVILGDTLLDQFTPGEIDVVFAHEVGHHVNRHIFKLISFGLLASGLGYLACDIGMKLMYAGNIPYASLPIATLPALMLIVTLSSTVIGPVQNLISRRFENQCDAYALRTTQDPDSYRSAFRKLARINKADPNPHPLEVFLFHDHPPIDERLALAEEPRE